jgi:hypothetical protein
VSAPVRNCYRDISDGAELRELLRGLTFSRLLCGERRGTLSAAMQRNESACRHMPSCGAVRHDQQRPFKEHVAMCTQASSFNEPTSRIRVRLVQQDGGVIALRCTHDGEYGDGCRLCVVV